MKTLVAITVLSLSLIAAAQQSAPKASLDQYMISRPQAAVMSSDAPQDQSPTIPPAYCNPCLFYGGNYNSSNPLKNSLINGAINNLNAGVIHAAIYVPFVIPAGQTWTITGIFANSFATINKAQALSWSFSKNVIGGVGGRTIALGLGNVSITPTGRQDLGLTEYTFLTTLDSAHAVTLTSGTYWMTAVPQCTGMNTICQSVMYYLSDVEDTPAHGAVGVELNDRSYITSLYYSYDYFATWGSGGACSGVGCDRFSVGLIGTKQ